MRPYPLLTCLLLALALPPARAEAAPPAPPQEAAPAASRVAIVEADADDPLVREAATRLRAELGAAGFEVVSVPRARDADARPRDGDARAALERAARDEGAFAAAAIFRSRAGATADLWIVDRVTQKTVVRTVEVAGAAAPSVMAVRAVELLQASLLEANLLTSRPPPGGGAAGSVAVPDDVRRWMAPVRRQAAADPAAERPGMLAGIGVEAGLAALQSTGGIGPALGPALRLSYGGGAAGGGVLPAGLAARLTFAGPTLAPALGDARALGTVSVRQEMALLEAVWALETGGAVSPVLSAGVGGFHLFISGDPLPPLRSATGEVWSVAAALGAGAGLRVTERAALLLDAHAIFAEPRAVVTLGGERLGSAGRPTFAGFLGLLVRL
ncbi:hypothetical protein [Sorangium sp. So ce1153]|uniref:hypothetical protein n=1 Tax=Sorangium sp. So ce1153 TaxID=3133333 RepID=UPI003F607010